VIERMDLLPYRLPLVRPWRTARGRMTERCGWLVRIRSHGLTGHGDCAPLPEAGTESMENACAALARLERAASGRAARDLLARARAEASAAPAAYYAVECAALDLAAQQVGLPLNRWLAPAAPAVVPVNAALGALDTVTREMVEASCRSGFRTLKVKVGIEPPTRELERLADLCRDLPPGAAFRLDANGAWSMSEAVRVIAGLDGLPVESLEEPLRNPARADLGRLQADAAFPLALDESLRRIDPELGLEELPVRRLVIKPAAVGGLTKTMELAARARDLGLQVIITSLIESAAGLWPTAQLAAALAFPEAQGLATSSWLQRDLGSAPLVAGGCITLPLRAGSGFHPHPEEGPHG
jgi:o-succinylbenzoate synthase